MSSYFITPQADKDLDELADYIAQNNIDAALRLYTSAEETYKNLSESPLIGAQYFTINPVLHGLRFHAIKDFDRYMVFYMPLDKGIKIIRILHSARDIQSLL